MKKASSSEALINDLIARTRVNLQEAQTLKDQPLDALNWRRHSMSWSTLECIEHLNLYGDFYLPEISRRITKSNHAPATDFQTGWLGDYFAKSMLPREKLNKMKTFKDKNPLGSNLDKNAIDRFIQQQEKTLELLEQARNTDLTKTKTAISISKWIKLRLGDTFRVVVYHNQRHLRQAFNTLAQYQAEHQ